jgi:thymidylate kinase
MKIVLAIEGTDGAGKSSVARYIQYLCEQHGLPYTRIGRRTGMVSSSVIKLTQLLREEVRDLTPQADVYLRMAREYQRAHLAFSAPPGIVVLDRFALTILALARLHGLDVASITAQLREIVARAALHATIFLQCPYEVATRRVQERSHGLPPGSHSETLLRRVAGFLEEEFHRGLLTGQQWLVENSKTFADGEEQVTRYLQPYLEEPSPRGLIRES